MEFDNIEKVIETRVKSGGNSARIYVPKEYENRECFVLIKEEVYQDFAVTSENFKIDVTVDFENDDIRYFNPSNGEYVEHISQVNSNWSYQNEETEAKYNEFLAEVEQIDLTWFAHLEVGGINIMPENIVITRIC